MNLFKFCSSISSLWLFTLLNLYSLHTVNVVNFEFIVSVSFSRRRNVFSFISSWKSALFSFVLSGYIFFSKSNLLLSALKCNVMFHSLPPYSRSPSTNSSYIMKRSIWLILWRNWIVYPSPLKSCCFWKEYIADSYVIPFY